MTRMTRNGDLEHSRSSFVAAVPEGQREMIINAARRLALLLRLRSLALMR